METFWSKGPKMWISVKTVKNSY